jgi:hypothetical protein
MSYNAQSELVLRLRKSILALDESQFAELSEQERKNLIAFERDAMNYEHRVAWALSDDSYRNGLQTHLAAQGVQYARAPFPSINTVIYLFTDLPGVEAFLAFHKPTH